MRSTPSAFGLSHLAITGAAGAGAGAGAAAAAGGGAAAGAGAGAFCAQTAAPAVDIIIAKAIAKALRIHVLHARKWLNWDSHLFIAALTSRVNAGPEKVEIASVCCAAMVNSGGAGRSQSRRVAATWDRSYLDDGFRREACDARARVNRQTFATAAAARARRGPDHGGDAGTLGLLWHRRVFRNRPHPLDACF